MKHAALKCVSEELKSTRRRCSPPWLRTETRRSTPQTSDTELVLAAVAQIVTRNDWAYSPLDYVAHTLKALPSLQRVAGIADDAEQVTACADPATVWSAEVECQAIASLDGALEIQTDWRTRRALAEDSSRCLTAVVTRVAESSRGFRARGPDDGHNHRQGAAFARAEV